MAVARFPPPDTTALALKDILKNLGVAPIVLQHWKINVEENYARRCYIITLSWRTYCIKKYIDEYDLSSYNNQTDALLEAGRFIAGQLWAFNAAEDEEHMEALVLLSMRPTNAPHTSHT